MCCEQTRSAMSKLAKLIIALIVVVVACYLYYVFNESDSAEENDNDHVIDAAQYEIDFEQEFRHYLYMGKHKNQRFNDLLNVVDQTPLKLADIPESLYPKKCLICRAFAYTALNRYRNETEVISFEAYLTELCQILTPFTDSVCYGVIDIYLPSIEYILNQRIDELTSDRVCGILFQYNECSTNRNIIEFHIDVDGRKPSITRAKTYDFNKIDESEALTIGHLTDFHYDELYAAGSSSRCIEPICCRRESTPKANSTEKAGKWGDFHVCDSPGFLVEEICSQMASNHKEIDWIYYTGDFADHFGWATSKSGVKHAIQFITETIKRNFPDKKIALILGNHDQHPSDAFAPRTVDDESVNSKWLYEFVAELWSDLLPKSALDTLRVGGYYTFVIQPGLRVVALNNNLCFTANIWLLYGESEMREQLQWFQETMLNAEKFNEKVHILAHVPPNTASCIRAWNREFERIIERFSHIISGHFNGHTHADEFVLHYKNSTDLAIGVAWNGGSGTSFIGLNPNYRLYTIERKTFEVIDHQTWIFNLTEANLSEMKPRWFKEYSFREAYNLSDVSPATLHSMLANKWQQDSTQIVPYWQFSVKRSDVKLENGSDQNCLEKLRQVALGEIENNFFD